MQKAFTKGTLIEFKEKKRVHVGEIKAVEHKANGGARYAVLDHDNHTFNIPDKAVNYAMPVSPDNERHVKQLMDEMADALEEPLADLERDLDISPDLLELAWEEAVEDEESDHEITAKSLVELIHSHPPKPIEAYKAWKLLKSESSHIFFKELKSNGRVVSFKAKTKKAVDASKVAFCTDPAHAESGICWV